MPAGFLMQRKPLYSILCRVRRPTCGLASSSDLPFSDILLSDSDVIDKDPRAGFLWRTM
jgi:hypothetical protein